MSSLKTFLPRSAQTFNDRDKQLGWKKDAESSSRHIVVSSPAPPNGARKGYVPRSTDDFGDGGAFPEIPVSQYPLGLGKKKEKTSANNLPVQLDSKGRIKYDVIARQGHSKDRVVFYKFQDLLPPEVTNEDDPTQQKPSEDEVKDATEATRLALEKLTQMKISAAMTVRAAEKTGPVQYIRYTQSQQGFAYNSGPKHMRLSADGRGLQQTHVNENFAKLAEVFYSVERKAREAVHMRIQLEKKIAQREKEKEENLRKLAQQAREQWAGIRTQPAADKDGEVRERESLRYEHHSYRFVPVKEFALTDRSGGREGPVQFEKQEEEDPFGLDKFLTEAKKASKQPTGNDYNRKKSKEKKE